jgi:hypothetical protein
VGANGTHCDGHERREKSGEVVARARVDDGLHRSGLCAHAA